MISLFPLFSPEFPDLFQTIEIYSLSERADLEKGAYCGGNILHFAGKHALMTFVARLLLVRSSFVVRRSSFYVLIKQPHGIMRNRTPFSISVIYKTYYSTKRTL